MHRLKTFSFPTLLTISIVVYCLSCGQNSPLKPNVESVKQLHRDGEEWTAPSEKDIPATAEGTLIRYGKELIAHTAKFLGPKGTVQMIANGTNCQNCHIAAGTQNFGNPFSAVASTYPKYRDRSGRVESIEFRVNDCLRRSMNGTTLDSQSREMQAMVAYIKWVGGDVPKSLRPQGAGTRELRLLDRAADPQKGKAVYIQNCQRCHGKAGEGLKAPDSIEYIYPPLWGDKSYNTGAGIYRLGLLAGFIRNNMPYGVNWISPTLTDEEAWDVAAFVASQPRPVKPFPADWKALSKKPADYPFAPFADSFSAQQHKFGPFGPMKKNKK